MKTIISGLAAALLVSGLGVSTLGMSALAGADETVGEKAKAAADDAGRSVKKGVHRAEEAVCAQSDAKCLAEKAKHRASEAKDYTKDKASEIKNDVDTDK